VRSNFIVLLFFLFCSISSNVHAFDVPIEKFDFSVSQGMSHQSDLFEQQKNSIPFDQGVSDMLQVTAGAQGKSGFGFEFAYFNISAINPGRENVEVGATRGLSLRFTRTFWSNARVEPRLYVGLLTWGTIMEEFYPNNETDFSPGKSGAGTDMGARLKINLTDQWGVLLRAGVLINRYNTIPNVGLGLAFGG
jgi:hypothetical protein